jgi:phenylalanyl-tRNA synthetase beta chain
VPVVSIDAARLNALMDNPYTPERLGDALEQIGCDVEEVIELPRYRCPNCGQMIEGSLGSETNTCGVCGHSQEAQFDEVDRITAIRLDLLAARPDLFDIGGLARALKGYLGEVRGLPQYVTAPSGWSVSIDPAMADHRRPYIRCAVVHVPPLDDVQLATIMKMQENLHWGVGRDRKLASIGVYDLDTLEGPIRYTSIDPTGTPFEPLGMPGQPMTGQQILEDHPKGPAYAALLDGCDRYPALIDANDQILSMPPVINSESTKVKVGTTRLFVDVTGPSEAAVANSLRMLVSSLIELGGTAYSVAVDGMTTPDLTPRTQTVSLARARTWLGLPFDAASLTDCFERMRLDVTAQADGDSFEITYPAFRSDIRHMVDLLEDLAIGYGYENIEPALVPTMTVGKPRSEEVISGQARTALQGLGYTEVMSLPMTTEADHFEKLRLPVPERYVRVANPKLKALTVVRSHLLGGVMNALAANKRRPMPIKLFELDNCVALDAKGLNGVREERRLCVAEMGPEAGYATVRSILDALMRELGLEAKIFATQHPSFVPGRVAGFDAGDFTGVIGEVHPEAIVNFGLDQPVALLELRLKTLVWD